MDLNLQGHRVVVTAGANGIGRAIVEAFLAEGARVATCDIDEEGLAAVLLEDLRRGSMPTNAGPRPGAQPT